MHGARIDHALHNYIYFAYYDKYIKVFVRAGRLGAAKLGNTWLARMVFKSMFGSYHAKVITLEDATKILTLNHSINLGPDTTERIIPFKLANKIILEEPEFIAVMDCPCRAERDNPCLPLNVCIAVGKTTANFWLDHGQKYHVRKITQKEALEIITRERGNGRITTAWFKVETGARTGVLCNCCSCCCGGLEGMRLAQGLENWEGIANIIPSGYTVVYDEGLCENCGDCAEVCMFEAIKPDEYGRPVYHKDVCMGCGLCVEKCSHGARSLSIDPEVGLPLDLDLAKEKLG